MENDLVLNNMGLAYTVANRWRRCAFGIFDFDDLVQDCLLAMIMASKVYDKTKGAFSIYAYLYMMGKMKHTLKTEKVEKINRNTCSLDYDLSKYGDGSRTALDLFEYKELFFEHEYEELIEAVDKLRRREKEVITALYFEGLSWDEIAEMKGVSKTTISNIHKRGKEHLKILLNK